ncbi:DUF4825 domain-containing protein [[Clostridium] symbiosum]|uniref:DUF4825 domain-containing protein n=1 Tax=Clostridium symbiosum TaxID=1512 RepID=UPI001D065347|nr:DUF4825 domain-containing protein [[Clostridium] symbiosum]MCB6609086.1 DUF4825 domain-containing protein [[Clostridium] symbiosum]MCB6930511.1 DUF4825 domain-containing protein [[Clostridium] symbiosum]
MKLKQAAVLSVLWVLIALSVSACSEKGDEYFNAVVTKVTEDGYTVEPFKGEAILKKASVIALSDTVLSTNEVPDLKPGDTARIVWNGKVEKGEPASLGTVFAVYRLPPLYSEELYQAKNKYIGDASADGRLFGLLSDCFNIGEERTTELQTSEEPYTYIIHFKSEPDTRRMYQAAGCLLALIENCGEVRWDYPSDGGGVKESKSLTAESAEELLGIEHIAEYGKSEESLSQLLDTLCRLPEINR